MLIGEGFGWRAAFIAVGGLAAISLIGIVAGLQRQLPGAAPGWRERLALAKRRDTLSILMTSVLTVAGTFTIYTYISVFLASVAGFGPRGLALGLLEFGIASALGSRLGGTAADRVGARITVAVCGGLAFIAYIVLWIGAAIEQRQAIVVVLPALLLWGLATWALMTAQQARLVAICPALAPVSLSLNSSAIYLGGAIGALMGAIIVADGVIGQLGLVAAGFSLVALLPVWAADDRRSA